MVAIKVDVTQPVYDWDGTTPLHHQRVVGDQVVDIRDDDGNPKAFVIRHAISRALTGLLPSEREAGDQPSDIKDDVFRVMCLVASQEQPLLEDADRVLITTRAKEICNALLYGRIREAFDAGEKVGPAPRGKPDKPPAEA